MTSLPSLEVKFVFFGKSPIEEQMERSFGGANGMEFLETLDLNNC